MWVVTEDELQKFEICQVNLINAKNVTGCAELLL
jgi:hypothetical protein